MARLRRDYAEFRRRGAEVVAVGPDEPGIFRLFWNTARIPFIGLPDPAHKVALRYRQEVNMFKLGRMPLVIVIDENGLVQYAHHANSMADIPSNEVLLGVIDQIAGSRRARDEALFGEKRSSTTDPIG